jgi:hypothetical protein
MSHLEQQQPQERLRQLAHDVQHCLHVIGMAAEILKGVRGDTDKVTELSNSIDKERQKAASLVNELVAAARQSRS